MHPASQEPSDAGERWTARLRGATEDTAARESALIELRDEALRAQAEREPGFAAAYAYAAYLCVADACESATTDRDVDAWAAQARSACANDRFLTQRWSAELTYAEWLLAQGRSADAQARLAAFPRAEPRLRSQALLERRLRISIARAAHDVEAARAIHGEAPAAIAGAELPPAEGRLRAAIESELCRAEIDAGVPDLAALALAAERSLVDSIQGRVDTPEGCEAWVRLRLDEALFALATEAFERAARICDEVLASPLDVQTSERLELLACLAIALDEHSRQGGDGYERALKVLDEVLRLAQPATGLALNARLMRAEMKLRTGDVDAAEIELRECAGLDALPANGVTSLEPRVRRRALLACAARLSARRRGEPDAASLESLRARRDELARALDESCAEWTRVAPRAGGVGLLYWGGQRFAVSELMRAEIELAPGTHGVERALDVLTRAQCAGSLARELASGPQPGWTQVREELLAPGRGILIVFPSLNDSDLLLVDQGGAVHVRLRASRDALVSAVNEALERIALPPGGAGEASASREEDVDSALATLRELVLPDEILPRLRSWNEIHILGTDICGQLPWECLPLDGAPLGVAKAVAHLPSLPAGYWISRRERSRTGSAAFDLAVIAAPRLSAQLASEHPAQIPFAIGAEEQRALLSSLSTDRVRWISGLDANLDQLASPDVAGASVLSVFAHGVYLSGRERPAALLLAEGTQHGGLLTCDDIEALERTPALVELLACGAGRGPARVGDDCGAHMASSFHRRGTCDVIVSRASLSLEATLELARHLNLALAEPGATPAEALRRARGALRSEARFRDPFYWGSVSLEGLGFGTSIHWVAPRTERPPLLWLAAGAALVLIGTGAWRLRRLRAPSPRAC